jgi:hypothetical protein
MTKKKAAAPTKKKKPLPPDVVARRNYRKPRVIDLVYETLREIRNSQARIEKQLRIGPPTLPEPEPPPPRIERQTPFNWAEPECHEHGCPPSQCVEAHRIEDANRRALESAAAMLEASKTNGFA